MTSGMQFNQKTLEALGMVLLTLLEEEMVSLAYGASQFLQQGMERGLDMQRQLQAYSSQGSGSLSGVEPLLSQLSRMTEQLQQRNQSVADLEARIADLERAQSGSVPASGWDPMELSPTRLMAIEDSLKSVELLAGGIGQQNEDLIQLQDRVASLETGLQSMPDLSSLLEQQMQILTRLEARIARLESLETDASSVQRIEGDRVI